jgi:hypothetical protein
MMVELVTMPQQEEAPKRQIVTASEATNATAPTTPTRLEAERESSAEKEQIRRGDPLAGAAIGEKGAAAPQRASQPAARQQTKPTSQARQAPSPREPRPAATEPLKDLLLDPETMLRSFAAPTKKTRNEQNPLAIDQASALAGYAPFSRPFGSGARFLGASGSSDYLPTLPDGDITLLNAKASQYAVFVRRVATQVFTELRTQGWEMLSGSDIRAATRFAVVEATLSPKGALLNVTLHSGSGSQRFDSLLQSAAKSGARDSNPPVGALAADGNIHFIFQAQSWVDLVPAPRSGVLSERRWLLLATGLE